MRLNTDPHGVGARLAALPYRERSPFPHFPRSLISEREREGEGEPHSLTSPPLPPLARNTFGSLFSLPRDPNAVHFFEMWKK